MKNPLSIFNFNLKKITAKNSCLTVQSISFLRLLCKNEEYIALFLRDTRLSKFSHCRTFIDRANNRDKVSLSLSRARGKRFISPPRKCPARLIRFTLIFFLCFTKKGRKKKGRKILTTKVGFKNNVDQRKTRNS